MVKYSLSVLSIASFFMLRWFFPADVKITPKAPDKLNAGEEFTYEVTVTKSGVTGFAKIQQELPSGCTAEQLEVKGASFSCVGGVVKMIWMSLPSEDEFTVSYKVKTDASLAGDQTITGKFSFLENNEKKSVDIPTSTISFPSAAVAESKPVESAPVETVASESNVTASAQVPVETASAPSVSASVSAEAPASSPSVTVANTVISNGLVSGERTITKTGEGKYRVDISIKNSGLSGFAKMQDVLPAGMLGYEDVSNSAVFSFVSSKVKFVWMSVPDQKDIKVSYVVTANNEVDLKNISGEFSYLENNETKRVSVATIALPGEGTPSLAQAETPAPSSTEKVVTEPVKTVESAVESTPVANEETSAPAPVEQVVKAAPKKETINTPDPSPISSGVAYKVQVCASKKDVGSTQDYFSKKYSFTEEKVNMETHEGWMKYTIGSFSNYKGARDRRNEVTSKYTFPGPFVTAYNNGKRITVQEALMVSRDKWVP